MDSYLRSGHGSECLPTDVHDGWCRSSTDWHGSRGREWLPFLAQDLATTTIRYR